MPTRSLADRALLRRRRVAYRVVKAERRRERDKALAIPDTRPVWDDLSPRLKDVAYLLACGYRARAGYRRLGISYRAWDKARERILRRLKMTPIMVARWVIDQGITIHEPSVDTARGRTYYQDMGKSLDVGTKVSRIVVDTMTNLRALAECGPLLVSNGTHDKEKAAKAIAAIRKEFDAAVEHLSKGTAPPSTVQFAL